MTAPGWIKKLLLGLVLAGITSAAGGIFLIHRLIAKDQLRELIEKEASDFLGRPLTVETVYMERWVPPVLVGSGLRLLDKDGSTMASSAKAVLRLRLGSIPMLAVAVRELRFINPVFHFRPGEDGKLNVLKMADSIRSRPEKGRGRGGMIFFERFAVEQGLLDVQDPGWSEAFAHPLRLEGAGSFQRFRLRAAFPFELNIRDGSSENGASARLNGRLGGAPRLRLEARSVPASLLHSRVGLLARCGGTFGLNLDYKGKAGLRKWSVEMDNSDLCPGASVPMPRLFLKNVPGPELSFAASLEGASTRIRVSGSAPPGAAGTLLIIVKSSRADLSEVAAWARALSGPGSLKPGQKPFRASGLAEIDGRISGPREDSFWSASSGTLTVEIKDGILWNEPTLLNILSKANIRFLVDLIRGQEQEGVPFKTVMAFLEIRQGRITAREPVVLESDKFQLAFVGEIDTLKKRVDGKAALRVVTVLDEVIGRIPIVRGVLHGEEASLLPVWLSVKGPLGDPEVEVLAGKSVTAPLWESVGRIFKIPEKALKMLRGKEK